MIFKRDFYVGYGDISKEYKLTNTSILKMFTDIAFIHARTMADDDLGQSDCSWFVTGYKVNILKRPEYAETITINTWAREMKGVQASREFAVYNSQNELCITGIANFIRINLKTGRLDRISNELLEKYAPETEKTNYGNCWLDKLKEGETEDFSRSIAVERHFIDAHNHVNNVNYLFMAQDVLPDEVYAKPEAKAFSIMYKSAVTYGEKIKACVCEKDSVYTVTVKGEEDNSLKAIVELEY